MASVKAGLDRNANMFLRCILGHSCIVQLSTPTAPAVVCSSRSSQPVPGAGDSHSSGGSRTRAAVGPVRSGPVRPLVQVQRTGGPSRRVAGSPDPSAQLRRRAAAAPLRLIDWVCLPMRPE